MRVIIAGGHGKIARILERMLTQRGDSVAGIIRNPAHSADLEQDGVEPVLLDMEAASAEDVAAHLDG
ncbi:MAG: NAD(P)H-binding protein, partial [Actinomycetota bacterium]|nr:NAD(P)H-binding protein [Actinomycetota bacterium]